MTNLAPAVIMTETSVVCIIDGKPYNVAKGHPNFQMVVEAVKEERWDDIPDLAVVEKAVATFMTRAVKGSDKISVHGGVVYWNKEAIHNTVAERILGIMEEGGNAKRLVLFLEKLMDNPSRRAVTELYKFLEHKGLPIGEDGCFYAYKAVTSSFKDKHTGTFDNSIGVTVKVRRNQVDENPERDCSQGLHAGSIEYVKSFAGSDDNIVIVKISPTDVVAVPYADAQKLRTCRYEVVEHFTGILPDAQYDHGQKDDDDNGVGSDKWFDEAEDDDEFEDNPLY